MNLFGKGVASRLTPSLFRSFLAALLLSVPGSLLSSLEASATLSVITSGTPEPAEKPELQKAEKAPEHKAAGGSLLQGALGSPEEMMRGLKAQEKVLRDSQYLERGEVPPASAPEGPGSLQSDPSQQDSESSAAQIEKLRQLTENPIFKWLVGLSKSPEFIANAQAVVETQKRKELMISQGVWVILFMILKFFVNAKATTLGRRLWNRVWTSSLFFTFSAFLIPSYWLGEPYLKLLKFLVSAAVSSF